MSIHFQPLTISQSGRPLHSDVRVSVVLRPKIAEKLRVNSGIPFDIVLPVDVILNCKYYIVQCCVDSLVIVHIAHTWPFLPAKYRYNYNEKLLVILGVEYIAL